MPHLGAVGLQAPGMARERLAEEAVIKQVIKSAWCVGGRTCSIQRKLSDTGQFFALSAHSAEVPQNIA